MRLSKKENGMTIVALIIIISIIALVIVISICLGVFIFSNPKSSDNNSNNIDNYSKNNSLQNNNTVNSNIENKEENVVGQQNQNIIDNEISKQSSIDKVNVGDYIDYVPDGKPYLITAGNSGYSEDQTFKETANKVKWRLWSKANDTITLISDKSIGSITFSGSNGYNNAIYLLNNACNSVYKNDNLGATARSISMEDIDNISKFDKSEYVSSEGYRYGDTEKYYSFYCPNIYKYEQENKITRSTQDKIYSGKEQVNLLACMTYYHYPIKENMTEPYYAIISCQSGNEGSNKFNSYWIASRTLWVSDKMTSFGVFTADEYYFWPISLYNVQDSAFENTRSVRPVITIDLSKVEIGATGNGTLEKPYSILTK